MQRAEPWTAPPGAAWLGRLLQRTAARLQGRQSRLLARAVRRALRPRMVQGYVMPAWGYAWVSPPTFFEVEGSVKSVVRSH